MPPAAEIYLDNAATTPMDPRVLGAMEEILREAYGNPSSLHGKGVQAERRLTRARHGIAAALGVGPEWIIFTSGGTEANNLAILGAARAYGRRGRHLIATAVEHPSVLSAMRRLEGEGWALTLLPVDAAGRIDPGALAAAIRPDTVLISVMAVNNEVGTVQPLDAVVSAVRAARGEGRLPLLHVDAVQGFGRVALPGTGVDLLAISAHKVHGPKGTGALAVRPGVRLEALLAGGEQERGIRPGTENVAGIVGFGEAAAQMAAAGTEAIEAQRRLRRHLVDRVTALPGVAVNGPPGAEAAPHILNVRVDGVRSETLIHRLEMDRVYISAGSACHAHDPRPSHVLTAMGLSREAALGSIRLSLSRLTTRDEVDAAADALARAVAELRVLA